MILYLSIIFGAGLIITILNSLFMNFNISTWAVAGIVALAIVISIALDALGAILVRIIPNKKFNPFAKFFCERKNERKFYEKLKIRKWKDVIPEMGKTLKFFDKTNLGDKPTAEHLYQFLIETCYAEVMHELGIFFSVFLLVILPSKYLLTISLPVLIVNIFLQILPICVQRYNRPKLIIAYNRLKKQEEKAKENLEQTKTI